MSYNTTLVIEGNWTNHSKGIFGEGSEFLATQNPYVEDPN